MAGKLDVLACIGCFQHCSRDQGICCPKGHFFCSVANQSPCVDSMVEAQMPSIRFQQASVLCPVCSSLVSLSSLQAHLTQTKWKQLDSAVAHARMEPKTNAIVKEPESIIATSTQQKAELVALQVRNETLNLMCPHCKTVYVDFDGCMAIMCESCTKWFCGFCHDSFPDSETSHEHVVKCSLNSNGSIDGSAEDVKKGQILYRSKKLKEVLRAQPKDVQQAAICLLKKDLADLGINRANLIEGSWWNPVHYCFQLCMRRH